MRVDARLAVTSRPLESLAVTLPLPLDAPLFHHIPGFKDMAPLPASGQRVIHFQKPWVGERLLRFEFPERPGALRRFLNQLRPDWNISLFHYRNHGAATGRVLVGIQVPASDGQAFASFLEELAYPFVDETQNPAYQLFLSPGS